MEQDKTRKNKDGLTVITPVKDDDRIYNLIGKFKTLDFGTDLEFLIVCNGSSETFVNTILQKTKDLDSSKVFTLETARMASAVNFGVKQASKPRVVMIDSDCLVNENTFRPMVDALQRSPIARGTVIFKGTNTISKLSAKLRTHVYEKENTLSFSPNTGFQKQVFSEVGYFRDFSNNDGRTYDSEWSYRAQKHGLEMTRARESKITHFCHTNVTSEVKISFHYGQGRAYCYRNRLLGDKSLGNFLKAMTIPFVFDRSEGLTYNLFVVGYVFVWNFGFITESIRRRLP